VTSSAGGGGRAGIVESIERGVRVLIADDSAGNVRLLTRILERGGYTDVSGVSDPSLVLARVRLLDPDLVILDLHMPKLDGLSLMDQIGQCADRDPRVLIVTGDVDERLGWEARSRGAHDVIIKPFDVEDVLARVRGLLARRRP
jgi:DNA-binding response OmpR family regulator